MHTAENLTQHVPFGHVKLIFYVKLITEKPGFYKQLQL